MKPSVLFVDDEPQVLDGLRDMLRSRRHDLRTTFAVGGEEALARLGVESFDVVVSDMRMPGIDGAQLLTHVRDHHEDAVRVVLSGQASEEAVLRAVPVAHIAVAKPCSGTQLNRVLDRACAIRGLLDDPGLRASVNRIGALPSPPDVATRLVEAIGDEQASASTLQVIVEGDVAFAAKVLQLVNSGFFGLPQEITDLRQGISLLGNELLRTLAITRGAMHELAPDPSLTGFSLSAFEQRSRLVARLAAGLCAGPADVRTAASAGLLHDIGSLVLVSRSPREFAAARRASEDDDIAIGEAEHAQLGTSHAAVGAYLLALWGLPDGVVDVVRRHDDRPLPTTVAAPQPVAEAVRIAVLLAASASAGREHERAERTLLEIAPAPVVEQWLALVDDERGA